MGDGSTGDSQLAELTARVAALEGRVQKGIADDRLSLLVFSGELDKQLAAFLLATTAAASGMKVTMFFTFWGLSALRDPKKRAKKDLLGRMFGWMLPKSSASLPMSSMNMGGAGPLMIRHLMKKKRFSSIEEMLAICAELGVEIAACEMSGSIMSISLEELIDYPHLTVCGAATFLDKAADSRVSMFV